MRLSHKLTQLLLSLAALVVVSASALAADPGAPVVPVFPSDQLPGNVLIYNIYTSSSTNPGVQDTRISITNTNDAFGIAVHLFFVDGRTCSVADSFVCLTKSQTMTFYASDMDPDTTGYIIAIATDSNGIPVPFTQVGPGARLIGDEQVKFASGHHASLGAVGVLGALAAVNGALNSGVEIAIDLPRVLAVANIASRADGNDTLLIVNRIGGDLRTSAATIGNLFGILFDELENGFSWTASGGCQLVRSLDNTFPRTTPRLTSVIPAGSVGWMKFWATSTDTLNVSEFGGPSALVVDRALTGAVINHNPNAATGARAFGAGHNLHELTAVTTTYLIFPIFPNNCDVSFDMAR
ncbi:MAG TPA: hypothetical protein VFD58_06080 [Blastocatellia bacterium]|nr:hypothetical protein [Blastocatellia bacterium]